MLHIESAFEMVVRRGRVYLNGVEQEHVLNRRDRTYTVATPLRDSPQLRRLLSNAMAAGETNVLRSGRAIFVGMTTQD